MSDIRKALEALLALDPAYRRGLDMIEAVMRCRAALAQPQAAQPAPPGWKLVPLEPTPEMERAAFDELELQGTATESGTMMRNRVYRAMLAATPPTEPQAAQPEAPAELRGLDTATRVRFYEHDFYVLSNFSAFTLQWKGIRFDTSEAAYHWEKFPGDSGVAQLTRHFIQTAPSAHEAFKIAEQNKEHRRADWDDVKVGIMLDILRAKAAQHEYVRRKLLATGDRELVEDSWRDDFWGWGPNRDGKNMLGRLWMQVRAELRDAATPPTEPQAAQPEAVATVHPESVRGLVESAGGIYLTGGDAAFTSAALAKFIVNAVLYATPPTEPAPGEES